MIEELKKLEGYRESAPGDLCCNCPVCCWRRHVETLPKKDALAFLEEKDCMLLDLIASGEKLWLKMSIAAVQVDLRNFRWAYDLTGTEKEGSLEPPEQEA